MILKVTPTRITLLNLKKELKVAQKGYMLLKDKRDGLMKKFMETVKGARTLREEVEEKLGGAFNSYVRATAMMTEKTTDVAFMLPNAKIDLGVKVRSVMSVPIPEFEIKKEGNAFSYGLLETSGDLDNAITKFDEVFPSIIKLAELEKAAEELALEIEKTRRRVSALENVRIPNLDETIHFITGRLEEQARDAIVSTMRVKAMIVAKES